MTTNTVAPADVQQTGKPILEVVDVTKTYGEGHTAVTAIAAASLSVAEGQFVSLLGPSGSGKTTLISMIGGLLTTVVPPMVVTPV